MKRSFLFFISCLVALSLQAKKIKFAVDMATHTVSPAGVHLISDFQVQTGFGTVNWDPSTMLLTKEGNTTIYSIVVNLPAFQKYEFKFVSGDQGYEAEFVPDPTRVGYNFNDNRWIYVDSLTNDTLYTGAVIFGGNAPAGKKSIRYLVNMNNVSNIPAAGVHVGTNYQTPTAFDPTKARLYSFGNNDYEIINYVNAGVQTFIYYYGNTIGTSETVPNSCATNGKRTFNLTQDTILPKVCFASCSSACVAFGISENSKGNFEIKLFPNPANEAFVIESNVSGTYHVIVFDNNGKPVQIIKDVNEKMIKIQTEHLPTGNYHVRVSPKNGISNTRSISVTH
jgi:hypothetical protein